MRGARIGNDMADHTGIRPLIGMVVVDATADRAGSTAGMLLADLGAEVVRVDTVDGANRRPHPSQLPDAVSWDRGKQEQVFASVDPDAGTGLADLLDRATVLLVDLTPARLDESALHPALAGKTRPGLVTVWTPPYGSHGARYRDLASDPLLQAAVTAYAMHQPAFDADVPIAPVVNILEVIQGSLAASAAVAGALEALRSGTGQLATVSGIDAAGALLATLRNDALDVENVIRPTRNPRIGPSFRPYRCGDGEVLFLATLIAPLFMKALDVLDAFEVMVLDGVDGEFLNLFRPDVGPKAAALLEKRFASQPRQHWIDRFTEAGVPSEPVLSRQEWLASEQFATIGGRFEFHHPVVGAVSTPQHPATFTPIGDGVDGDGVWPHGSHEISRPGPLAGLRVLDLATFLAGPFAPGLFAHWGAEVIKVETGEGDPYRAYSISYLAVNQAKRSVHLDLDRPEDRSAFERLVADADVLVDNLRPSTREKLGLGRDALARLNPALVHGNVTSFGPGPYEERPGFDPCIQAISGMMWATGPPDEPLNTTTPVHDVAAGSSIALGVLASLWQRVRTGTVSAVTTSLAAGSSLLQCAELTDFAGRPEPARGGIDFTGPSSERRFHRASNGWVGVAAPSVEALYEALVGDAPPDGDLAPAIDKAIAHLTVSDALAVLQQESIDAAEVVGATWDRDPYLEENGFTHVVVDPSFGRCRVMRGVGTWYRSGVRLVDEMVEAGGDTKAVRDQGWQGLP